jgi:hypothetical protein
VKRLFNDRMKWGAAVLLGGVALGAAGLTWMSRSPIVFTRVAGRGQSVVIDFQSDGCFSHAHFRLRFEPTPVPRLLVADCEPRLMDAKGSVVGRSRSPLELAAVDLTPEQVARLDNLLRFYRKHDGEDGCTTTDTISVVLYQHGIPVKWERYVDSTCRVELLADADPRDLAALRRDEAPVLSLRSVIGQAAQAEARGLSSVPYQAAQRKQTGAYSALREHG